MAIFFPLGFADLHQTSYVSKAFSTRADQASGAFYGIHCGGTVPLNCTMIICKLDKLVLDLGSDCGAVQDGAARKATLHFVSIQSVSAAEFGYCIEHVKGNPLKFC